jgi:hypothetical protein
VREIVIRPTILTINVYRLLGFRPATHQHVDAFRHQAGPPRLMGRADSRSVVAMEVFIKQEQVPPVRVLLKFFHTAEHRPAAVRPAQKEMREPTRELIGDIAKMHVSV